MGESSVTEQQLRLRISDEDPLYTGQRKLALRGKDLRNLPAATFELVDLEVLDLSPDRTASLGWKLPKVPPEIARLQNLKILILDTNDLETLPVEIGLLVKLERLALSNNRLTNLPHGFEKLRNLQSLHLAKNEFDEIPIPLLKLENLEFLDMSDNSIKSLPKEIGHLNKLHTLLLMYNKLETLPDSLCAMEELRCLWLGYNEIMRLPKRFGKLTNLDWGVYYTSSILDGNPLSCPPIEICHKGLGEIDRYLAGMGDEENENVRSGMDWEAERDDSKDGHIFKDEPKSQSDHNDRDDDKLHLSYSSSENREGKRSGNRRSVSFEILQSVQEDEEEA